MDEPKTKKKQMTMILMKFRGPLLLTTLKEIYREYNFLGILAKEFSCLRYSQTVWVFHKNSYSLSDITAPVIYFQYTHPNWYGYNRSNMVMVHWTISVLENQLNFK